MSKDVGKVCKQTVSTSYLNTAIKYNHKNIDTGTMMCIDPGSVHMGWARYENGELVESGKFDHSHLRQMGPRMREIGKKLRQLPPVDLLVIENIREPNSKTVYRSYMRLLKTIGAVMSNVDYKYLLEIHPNTWKQFTDDGWKKDDELDAIYLGIAAKGLSKLYQETRS